MVAVCMGFSKDLYNDHEYFLLTKQVNPRGACGHDGDEFEVVGYEVKKETDILAVSVMNDVNLQAQ